MVKIKFCGITRLEDYQYAVEIGADYVGFIFSENSPRYVTVDTVRRIVESDSNCHIEKVGVFVNHSMVEVQSIMKACSLNIAQLHGDESTQKCNEYTDANINIWKAMRPNKISDLNDVSAYHTNYILLDAYSQTARGGTGKVIPNNILKSAANTLALLNKKLIIAGGLSADNCAACIAFQPFCLDFNSAIENAPGVKNHAKMQEVVQILRSLR